MNKAKEIEFQKGRLAIFGKEIDTIDESQAILNGKKRAVWEEIENIRQKIKELENES
jgi:uncharacterized protein YlzI (FlbEa/FlbD family)